jgi:hypothetical protein
MTFIQAIPEDDASGAVAEMYETDRQSFGHLPDRRAPDSRSLTVSRAGFGGEGWLHVASASR